MKRAVGAVLGLYLLYAALASVAAPVFLYPFSETPFEHPEFRAERFGTATAYVHDAGPTAPIVLYFMGNAGSLAYFAPSLDWHAAEGRSVVALGYPGGGGLEGRPGEEALKRDALEVFDHLPDTAVPVIVHGYSLGTGLALHVAARRDVDAVILSAPYARLCDLMTAQSALPACRMPWLDRWRSDLDASGVSAPVLILHGDRDTLIPIAQADKLSEAFGAAPDFARIEGAGHTDLVSHPEFFSAIESFVAAHLP